MPAPLPALGMDNEADAAACELIALREEVARLRDQFELACELGRLGSWEHDLVSGEDRWDAAMWRLWGTPPQPRPPTQAEYQARIDAGDREVVRALTAESIHHPGRYEVPFRLNRDDGARLRLHLRWDVRTDAAGRPVRMVGTMRDDTEAHQFAARADEARSQLRLAADLAAIAVWRRDLASGEIRLDATGFAVIGMPLREAPLSAAEWQALLHPDDYAELGRQLAEAVRGRIQAPQDFTVRLRHADGSWHHLLIRSVLQRDERGRVVASTGVAFDVSERLQAEQRALELGRRLEMATAAAGVATWDWLPAHEWHWDAQMRRLHGLTADEPLPSPAHYTDEFVHPDDRAGARDAIAMLRQRADYMADLDLRLTGRDGVQRRVASRSAVTTVDGRRRVFGVMIDVTARHAAERRLRQADERALLVARGAGIGTWESDAEGRRGWWDAQMYRLRGREPRSGPVTLDEIIEWVHPDDRAWFTEVRARGGMRVPSPNYEFRVVWPDGSVHWIAGRASSVADESGRIVGHTGINWDVTETRAAAAALQDKLLAQRESQAKSRFLARMSHELRTPLNAVLGFSQLLLAQGMGADAALQRLRIEHIRAAGEHLLTLVNDVLDLSALESGELPLQRQAIEAATLARTTLPLLQPQADSAGVRLRLGALEGYALADAVRLRQALINLLSNAIKYNRPGGEVCIDARTHEGRLRLRVTDTGIGMSEAQRARLFEPFNRLGRERGRIEGSGIGLAIVKASIERMGGAIRVASREGEGSSFELDLPPADAAAIAGAAAPAPTPAPAAPEGSAPA